VKVILSVEALEPVLSGIGRYTWELASRLPMSLDARDVRFYRNGLWIDDPAALLRHAQSPAKKMAWRLPRSIRRWFNPIQLEFNCQGQVFHGPNYFIPACADIGIVTVHDLSVFKFPETHPEARIRHFEREFQSSMDRAVHLITDCESMRKEVMDFLGWPADKITAVPLGVSGDFAVKEASEIDARLKNYGLESGAYVLCVSTLEPRKKIDALLAAYRLLPRAVRELNPLVLVGPTGWLNEQLHQQIKQAEQEGWLRYHGFVNQPDLPYLFAGAKLFIYPSIYEGFGLPVLEAMASGVPVVASNSSTLAEVTQGMALLADPDDHEALKIVFFKALTDEVWRSSARIGGLRIASDLTWDRCVAATIDVYRQALSRH
jgi:alpha-1,3-rhamnosyl/mannosyltransferase